MRPSALPLTRFESTSCLYSDVGTRGQAGSHGTDVRAALAAHHRGFAEVLRRERGCHRWVRPDWKDVLSAELA